MNEHNVPGEGNEKIQAEQFEPDLVAEPPHPINWNLLTSQDLEEELLELNRWVNWLRMEYGLPAAVIPPIWHRHPELLWELSALHLHWLSAYDANQDGSAPFGWHRDLTGIARRGKPSGLARNAPSTSWSRPSWIGMLISYSSCSNRLRRAGPQRMRSTQASTIGPGRCLVRSSSAFTC